MTPWPFGCHRLSRFQPLGEPLWRSAIRSWWTATKSGLSTWHDEWSVDSYSFARQSAVVSPDLEALRNRLTELGDEPTEELLGVAREILAIEAGDREATNRLGVALIDLERWEEAR